MTTAAPAACTSCSTPGRSRTTTSSTTPGTATARSPGTSSRARCRSGRRAPTRSPRPDGAHRGHLHDHHRPLDPDARHDQAQGREGHPRHGSQGAQEARRGLIAACARSSSPAPAGPVPRRWPRPPPSAPPARDAARVLLSRQAAPVARAGRRARSRGRPSSTRRPPSSSCGAARPAPSPTSLPQLTLPPAELRRPAAGHRGARPVRRARRGADADLVGARRRPARRRRRPWSALPATLRWWLDQLLPPGMRALGAVRTAAVALGAAKRGPVDAALAARARRRGPARPATGWPIPSTPPSAWSPSRARATVARAARGGHRRWRCTACAPGRVLARVLPGWPARGSGAAQRAAEQDEALAALAERRAGAPRPGAGRRARRRRRGWPALLDGFEPPAAGGARGAGGRADREDGWQLTLPLPFAERGAVDLTRWVDDLVVTVGRRPPVDPARRAAAPLRGDRRPARTTRAPPAPRLEVSFRPDPRLWPADLLAAEGRTP